MQLNLIHTSNFIKRTNFYFSHISGNTQPFFVQHSSSFDKTEPFLVKMQPILVKTHPHFVKMKPHFVKMEAILVKSKPIFDKTEPISAKYT
jgi:hypothetical protein